MAIETVADFIARIGLRPDQASFDLATRLINQAKAALVGLVAYKGLDFIKDSLSSVVEEGGKLADMAQTIGVSAETLQEVGYAAQLSGGSLDSAASLLKKFSKNVQSAADGSKEARKSLKEVGVDYRDILSGAEPLDGALEVVADRFAGMENGPKKVALAMKLFGRSGADLIPLLNEGSEGIKKMRAEYRELGGVISEQDTKDLEAFGDATDKMDVAIGGLKKQVAVALLPTLSKLVAKMTQWFKENRKAIASKLTVVLKLLISALEGVVKGFEILIKLTEFLAPHWKLLIVIAGSLAAAMLILGETSIMAALASAAAWIAAAIPYIALAAAIAFVILLVEDLWAWFNDGDSVLKDLWQSFKDWIGDGVTAIFQTTADFIKDVFTAVFDWIAEKIEWIAGKIEWIFDKLEEAYDWLADDSGRPQEVGIVGAVADTAAGVVDSADQYLQSKGYMGIDDMLGAGKDFFTDGQHSRDKAAAERFIRDTATSVLSNINITVPPGTDAQGVANAARQAQEELWSEKLRDLFGGR